MLKNRLGDATTAPKEANVLQRFAVLLCASVLTVACSQSDAGITTKVKTKFAADDTVKAHEINVTTNDHVVTLSGEVATTAAKDQAIQIARQTEGVRDVVDQLTVKETAPTSGLPSDNPDLSDRARGTASEAGEKMTDAAITAAVKSKLLADTMVSGLKINVDTSNAVVTLTGPVKSQAEANQAEKLAKETRGVERVIVDLKVGH
jgi:hyperosmotically inducible protein